MRIIREAVPADRNDISALLENNIGGGPYLDSCLEKLFLPGTYTFICVEDGRTVSFVMLLEGAHISRTDFDGYSRLLSVLEGKKVFTGYILVVDKSVSGRNIGHEMTDFAIDRLRTIGAELVYYEFIIPRSMHDAFAAGKIHWAVRSSFKQTAFYLYLPEYFAFTTPDPADYCVNCNGPCHCGAVLFAGEVRGRGEGRGGRGGRESLLSLQESSKEH